MTALKAVQEEALTRASGARTYGFGMDMGLGKSLTALTEFRTLVALDAADRMLVISPNSFKPGWVAQVEEHGLDFDCHVFEASKARKNQQWLTKEFDRPPVLVVNYESFRAEHVQELIKAYGEGKRVYAVFDESIKLKNRKADQTKAALKMAPTFQYVRLLSGMMMTQGPHDLWAQLRILRHMPMTFFKFRDEYCRMGGYMGKEVIGVRNQEQLRRVVDRCVFVATKAEWGFDIPKSFVNRYYEMKGPLKAKYDEMMEQFLVWLDDHEHVAVEIAISKYEKCAQIQCGFIIDEDGEVNWLTDRAQNPRLLLLEELLKEELPGQKVCVVYRHRAVAEMLQMELAKAGYEPMLIQGGMKPDAIEYAKDQFNTNPAVRVMLLQADAAKYGHTLVGTEQDPCSTMIFFENSYSLDTRRQIEDRIHRYGQVGESCTYIDMVGSDIDGRIITALQKKEGMFRAVFRREPLEEAA